MKQVTEFKSDKATTSKGKNNTLSRHLAGPWNPYHIVKIVRIEIGSIQGWEVTHRQ